ncbi:toluene-4-monooxygenase system B family protein [Gordonia sp. PDNC005]|uniref:toluene-4-monooxygenase system B family protein n=1 Tax=Gordonia sp. PDNC005 TaxID=2811424 RepID=UPI001966632C|nr:toluene-4-monooxygenase system B family protein [Gordonia sp. PDNC005]QRY61168.1 toluene-4-monooxygenase system B family protein [Gordonia sp. PDNC005]
MALFPISSHFHGDFVLKLVPVDTENTMDEVAIAAAEHSVGVHVPDQPGKVIRARKQGASEPFPRTMILADTGLEPTDTVEFYYSEA